MLGLALGIVRRRELAEDVVQDSLVKAYEKLHSFRGSSSLSTWLYRIVYTTAVSSLRRGSEMVSDTATLPADPDDEGEWELTEANIAKMNVALGLLPPLDRAIIDLFYIEDKSIREIATICSESESNVKTRLHRARRRLREIMNKI